MNRSQKISAISDDYFTSSLSVKENRKQSKSENNNYLQSIVDINRNPDVGFNRKSKTNVEINKKPLEKKS
jgi:hypothetical protein